MKVAQHIFRRARGFFAATYTVDLTEFHASFFPQLGNPPLNVLVLCDARKLQESLGAMQQRGTLSDLQRTGQQYLLRSVNWRGGAFHPKTYLTVTAREAQLVVGSGNLGAGGLSNGNEVASVVSTTTDLGSAAIGAFARWADRIVEQLGDALLLERWRRLLQDEVVLHDLPDAPSPFLHNLDTSIGDQLLHSAGGTTDRVEVCAPFWDRDLGAIRRLVTGLRPCEVVVRLAAGTSVDGARLRDLLGGACERVRFLRTGGEAIHAKLVAVFQGDEALLLSGSPNMSAPALWSSGGRGNCETAWLRPCPAVTAEAVMAGRFPWSPLAPADMGGYSWRRDNDIDYAREITLDGAVADDEVSQLTVRGHGTVPEAAQLVLVTSRRTEHLTVPPSDAEAADWVHTAALHEEVDLSLPATVYIADGDGIRVSTITVVDNPRALSAMLTQRAATDYPLDQIPTAADNPLLKQFIEWMRGGIDLGPPGLLAEQASPRGGAHRAARPVPLPRDDDGEPDEAELDFLERRSRWGRWARRASLDDLLAQLALLGAGVPTRPPPGHRGPTAPPGSPQPGHMPTPNEQLRLANGMDRVVAGVLDARLLERDLERAAVNIRTLVEGLWALQEIPELRVKLTEERRRRLAKSTLLGLCGDHTVFGLLRSRTEAERRLVAETLGDEIPLLIGDLVTNALVPTPGVWRLPDLWDWQPALEKAVELGLLRGRDSADEVTLRGMIAHCDAEHWVLRMHRLHGLPVLVDLDDERPPILWMRLAMEPARLFDEPQVATAVSEWLSRSPDGERLTLRVRPPGAIADDDKWRCSFAVGSPAFAHWPGCRADDTASGMPVGETMLRILREPGATLRRLFPAAPHPRRPMPAGTRHRR